MKKRIFLAGALAVFVLLLWHLGWLDALTFEDLRSRREELRFEVERSFARSLTLFFLVYLAMTSLSVPGATILTLAAGALFGLVTGFLLVSFASTAGASVAFLLSRFFFRAWVERNFSTIAARVNRGFEREGALYLLMLRLLPIMPFFICNILMGLTRIRLWKYALVSQIGMIPATLLYVNAGTQLSRIQSPADVLSPIVLASLCLLGIFPWIAKRGLEAWKRGGHSA